MSDATEYRKRAGVYRQQAKRVGPGDLADQLEELAMMCLHLAYLTERGDISDLVYEPNPPKLSGR